MKNKLTALIAALLMVSCADRSHDSFIEDINGGKTTVTPTPTPKPQPTPVPTPQPKPVKPKQKIKLTEEYQKIETLNDFEIPNFLKGTYRGEFIGREIHAIVKLEQEEISVQTLTNLNNVSKRTLSNYEHSNLEALNYFRYTNEEHAKAGRNIKIVDLKVGLGTPEDPDIPYIKDISIRGSYIKDGVYNSIWFNFASIYNSNEVQVEFRVPNRHINYSVPHLGFLYKI